MADEKIHAEMKVAEVLRRYPGAAEVFRKRGYPDLSGILLSFTLKLISVKTAARIRKIPLDDLLTELNAITERR